MERFVITTDDGSNSIFIPELDESYHSKYGSIQESKHVFINAGLHYFKEKETIHILEIGFGTGLNCLLTIQETINTNQIINFVGIEAYPLEKELYKQLNYSDLLQLNHSIFNNIHDCSWNKDTAITPNFILKKEDIKIENIQYINQFDIIYFDAFAPSAQPHLWTINIFEKMYNALKLNGILVTYCAKGEVKRILKSTGFKVEKLPGPIGKREMTRAIKI